MLSVGGKLGHSTAKNRIAQHCAAMRAIADSLFICWRKLIFVTDESTRVSLQPIRGVEGSDYINASFVDVSAVNLPHASLPDVLWS